MGRTDPIRFPKWLLLTFAVIGGFGAAFGFIVYVANGMVVGDLIGLPGREHDIAAAQHRSSLGILSCVLLQSGMAGALFSYADQEKGHCIGRIVRAVLVSFLVTSACGIVILFGMRALR